jgi:hypothetical protein
VKVFEVPTCANPLGENPPNLEALTFVTPDPSPVNDVALTLPPTLTLLPFCVMVESPIVTLSVQSGIVFGVPLPLTGGYLVGR